MLQRRLTDVERTETTAGPEPREGSHHTQVFHHTVGYSMQKLKTSKQQFLDRFSRELDAIEAKAPMQGSYERIKPYIVDHQVGGQDFEFIIYHKESESWFGGNGGDAAGTGGIGGQGGAAGSGGSDGSAGAAGATSYDTSFTTLAPRA